MYNPIIAHPQALSDEYSSCAKYGVILFLLSFADSLSFIYVLDATPPTNTTSSKLYFLHKNKTDLSRYLTAASITAFDTYSLLLVSIRLLSWFSSPDTFIYTSLTDVFIPFSMLSLHFTAFLSMHLPAPLFNAYSVYKLSKTYIPCSFNYFGFISVIIVSAD